MRSICSAEVQSALRWSNQQGFAPAQDGVRMDEVSVTRRVADRVRSLRAERSWSARELAEACIRAGAPSLTRSTIAKIESGTRKSVTAEEIAVLAQVFEVSTSELLGSGSDLDPLRADWSQVPRATDLPQVWGREIPFRNLDFTGRETELAALRGRLVSESTAPQVLYGLGGVGKTEIAAEYAHRFADDYDVVWWVRAEREEIIRASLVSLGRLLQLPMEGRDITGDVEAVLDALRTGDPSRRWLLVFDNVEDPVMLREYVPDGPGHAIITSRVARWRQALRVDGVEVGVFTRPETMEYLRRRTRGLERESPAVPEDLATELGDLPLAVEYTAAFLTATGLPVTSYLDRWRDNVHELLATPVDIYYSGQVATTWRVPPGKVTEDAELLFRLLAYFGPDPVPAELLAIRPDTAPVPVDRLLSNRAELRRALDELARFSLVRLSAGASTVEVHRVVQAVTRGRLEQEDPQLAEELRRCVHVLLAASDPGHPEDDDSDRRYEWSRRHLIPSGALESRDARVQALVINQLTRLNARGDVRQSVELGRQALASWGDEDWPDDLSILHLRVQLAIALRVSGQGDEARRLNAETLERLLGSQGEQHEVTLLCRASHNIDLRLAGAYDAALAEDERLVEMQEHLYGADDRQTMVVRDNLAADLRSLGRFVQALDVDQRVHSWYEAELGPLDRRSLASSLMVARDLRQLGRYEQALEIVRRVTEATEDREEPWNADRLNGLTELGLSLRRAGHHREARERLEESFERHRATLGDSHRQTLTTATNLIHDRRLNWDLASAESLGHDIVAEWDAVAGPDHPNTCAASANLAITLRAAGMAKLAGQRNEQALSTLRERLGTAHPFTLAVQTNLASDLAAQGEVDRAARLGEEVVAASSETLGERHVHTLAASANLAFDRRALGDEGEAPEMRYRAIRLFDETLGRDHPTVRLLIGGGRVDVDVEPMSL
ncbi:tetratricopeptide repeat protein [Actinomadura barringtoniae]|uniref:Tetratricopeptide repeat protein n=1 Tax=Actinomadura barringtoniae TaxID=1427535 RepID=A0A939PVX4_9ACTN|nr:FxSxx-COOH system tetratricopeptide repeat protein [Actinomadura barringtoniae]MBO2455806.1 tetratricopeptide repeat protein [Actinomadura barringtoniae]